MSIALLLEVGVILRLTVGLGIEYPCGTCDQILFPLLTTGALSGLYTNITPVGSLENAVLYCGLFTKPYDSNGGDGTVAHRRCRGNAVA
jgi:hypothetical protein